MGEDGRWWKNQAHCGTQDEGKGQGQEENNQCSGKSCGFRLYQAWQQNSFFDKETVPGHCAFIEIQMICHVFFCSWVIGATLLRFIAELKRRYDWEPELYERVSWHIFSLIDVAHNW